MKKLKAKATRRTAKKASMEKKVKSTWKENNVSACQYIFHFGTLINIAR